MEWKNIDLAEKVIRYRPSKTKRFAKNIVCPIHPCLEKFLLDLPSVDSPDTPLAPSLAKSYTGGRGGLSNKFEQILLKSGMDNPAIVEGKGKGRAVKAFGFHSFRHTFKSILVNAGVEVLTADVLTGHAKKNVSERYIHRSIDLLRSAVEKLPALQI
jgi:integrase